jgi:hypothetical protein
MREVISRLMLCVDEAWLTHATRIRLHCTVTQADIHVEDSLFQVEAMLQKAQRALLPRMRVAPPAPAPQIRSSNPLGFQPH